MQQAFASVWRYAWVRVVLHAFLSVCCWHFCGSDEPRLVLGVGGFSHRVSGSPTPELDAAALSRGVVGVAPLFSSAPRDLGAYFFSALRFG